MAWRPTDYRCALEPQWIDYNGHLRDAYYTLVFSQAIDALMDQVGIDQPYRAATACTLFTLELHMHYLNEIKASDTISVRSRALGVDAKRIHLGLALSCPRLAEPAALGECMLLHVHQGPATKSAEFPAAIRQRLADWHALDAGLPPPALGSRKMQLPVR
jgi:acyl-CoA thioester hydrolase